MNLYESVLGWVLHDVRKRSLPESLLDEYLDAMTRREFLQAISDGLVNLQPSVDPASGSGAIPGGWKLFDREDIEVAKETIDQIDVFLADAPKEKPHTGYRYGELLALAAALLRKAYLP